MAIEPIWNQDSRHVDARASFGKASLLAILVPAGMQYTILDDYHFPAAGWSNDQLTNYFITEDDGNVLRVFPGSEKLRYLLPFAPAQDTIDILPNGGSDSPPGPTLLVRDYGEKFGTWPDTNESHVYERGWLRSFLDAFDG